MAYHAGMQTASYITVQSDRVHTNTPNPFKRQTIRTPAPKKSNADMSGLMAEGIVVVLGGLGKGGASVETLTRHPALRNPDLDWLQEFAYIYKTGWLDSESSEVPSTVVRVLPKKESRVETKPVEDKPAMPTFPDAFDTASDTASDTPSIRLERKRTRIGSRRDRKLSAWKARHLESACQHCRSQHSMCDRAQPSCTTCRDAARHCSYGTVSTPDWRGWTRPSTVSNRFDLDATVSKLKSWLRSRPHHNSPQLGVQDEPERRPSLSSHLSGWFANAKKRYSPTSLSSSVGRSRGGSDADSRGKKEIGCGVTELVKVTENLDLATSHVMEVKKMGLSVKSHAATVVEPPKSESSPPTAARSRRSSDRRSSLTYSDSFQQKVTIALEKAADDAKHALPDCPSRPFQCTFCLQQCVTKMAWQQHEESHEHIPQSGKDQHRRHEKPVKDRNSLGSSGVDWNWNCGFCHKTLTTWGERVYHIGKHYDNNMTMACWDPLTSPYPFDKASLTYVAESPRWSAVKLLVAQRPELFNHITLTGETEKLFRCRFCDTRYRTWEEFECHHELWHRRHYTWSCPTVGDLSDRLLQEPWPQPTTMETTGGSEGNTDPSLPLTICPGCGTPTPAPYLLSHLSAAHRFDTCTRHGVRFTTERHFRMHLINRHGFHEGSASGEDFVESCRKAEAPLEVERKEVVGRR